MAAPASNWYPRPCSNFQCGADAHLAFEGPDGNLMQACHPDETYYRIREIGQDFFEVGLIHHTFKKVTSRTQCQQCSPKERTYTRLAEYAKRFKINDKELAARVKEAGDDMQTYPQALKDKIYFLLKPKVDTWRQKAVPLKEEKCFISEDGFHPEGYM